MQSIISKCTSCHLFPYSGFRQCAVHSGPLKAIEAFPHRRALWSAESEATFKNFATFLLCLDYEMLLRSLGSNNTPKCVHRGSIQAVCLFMFKI